MILPTFLAEVQSHEFTYENYEPMPDSPPTPKGPFLLILKKQKVDKSTMPFSALLSPSFLLRQFQLPRNSLNM